MSNHLFKPGVSGNPKGRPKGSKDRRSYLKDVWEACEQVNVDPFLILAKIAAGILKTDDDKPEKINAYLRKEAAAELCQYLKPKLKAIDLNTGENQGVNFYFNMSPMENQHEKENEA